MSKKFTLNQLTEGIRSRNVGQEGARLTEKWSRTGLLRGLEETNRENMALMLENQAAQLLRESNSMGSGEVGGFTNIAFPIVRRVFGGLVANELVSIQPMSLPSGLLFYLDYTYGSNVGGAASADVNVYEAGQSIYNNPAGRGIQSGSLASGGQYDLVGSGYSAGPHTTTTVTGAEAVASATYADATALAAAVSSATAAIQTSSTSLVGLAFNGTASATSAKGLMKAGGWDAALVADYTATSADCNVQWDAVAIPLALMTGFDRTQVKNLALWGLDGWSTDIEAMQSGDGHANLRRLNVVGDWDGSSFTADPLGGSHVLCFVKRDTDDTVVSHGEAVATADWSATTASVAVNAKVNVSFPMVDTVSQSGDTGAGTGELEGDPQWESNDFDGNPVIPEIDIKIESIAVTAQTRKLRARWSPELAQDLNAYHSMDAEVELTQILSEQVALEIDREILNDLLVGANGANLYWSRAPGRFLNKNTGDAISSDDIGYAEVAFTGTVREWYETLTETIIDVANQIHRKTLRGSANFIVVGPDVATILESSVMYKPNYKLDGQGQVGSSFSIGAEKVGALSNRFTVYKDPYFPSNKVLVGFKGGSYLETGYVYAPYVPLIVTPTIFQPDDFTPRKGVMTRYGKKMVRSDFYGTVTILDMHII